MIGGWASHQIHDPRRHSRPRIQIGQRREGSSIRARRSTSRLPCFAAPTTKFTSRTLELLEAILAIAFLTGGLTATLRSDSAQLTLLAVSVAVLGVATVGLAVLW